MSDYHELLIGCGSRRVKDLRLPTALEIAGMHGYHIQHVTTFGLRRTEGTGGFQMSHDKIVGSDFRGLVTLDNNLDHKPDILCDLTTPKKLLSCDMPRLVAEKIAKWGNSEPELIDSAFDELHAYEVLEHIGEQGNAELFFLQFTEFHRILKPGGLFFATCPSWRSMWAWGDPSHSRVITAGTLSFLSQAEYAKQVGKTPMSDFRHIYKADFEPVYVHEDDNYLGFVLRAIK